MKPLFDTVRQNFYSAEKVKQRKLFAEIGWMALLGKPNWKNTCAIRMSLALVKSGIAIPGGSMRINSGPHRGKRIEPRQAELSRILALPAMFGTPEVLQSKDGDLMDKIGRRLGVISFFNIDPGGPRQGHIDLVSPVREYTACETYCYWDSQTIWFWPLP